MRPLHFFFIFMILCSVSVVGTYERLGGQDQYYDSDSGLFNLALSSTTTSLRSLSSPQGAPYISDLQGDGKNEIIIIDDKNIKVFQNTTLDVVDFYDALYKPKSGLTITDLDNDGLKEIIFYRSDDIVLLNYDGNNFTVKKTFTTSQHYNQSIINCDFDNDRCIFIAENAGKFASPTAIVSWGFNATHYGAQPGGAGYNVVTDAYNSMKCFANIPQMHVLDANNNGLKDFGFSIAHGTDTNANDDIFTYFIEVNGSLHVSASDGDFSIETFNIIDSGYTCEANAPSRYFTSPLIMDVDGANSNGLETVIGVAVDDDEFKMYSYDREGDQIDDYPELLYADGEMIGNPMKMSSATDTGDKDFCILGARTDIDEIDLLCASELTGDIPKTHEFQGDVSSLYNIGSSFRNFHLLTHSTQQTQDLTSGTNLDEISTSYGIWELDYSGVQCSVGNVCDLELIFNNELGNATVLMDDYENLEFADMIALTDTNLWYIDDGFTNSPAYHGEITINPCLDGIWQENTTVEVRIEVNDPDGDEVKANATLYYGSEYAKHYNWTEYFSDGTTFTFTWNADETINVGTLRLNYQDDQNNETGTRSFTFSVQTSGLEYGDCITTIEGEGTGSEEGEGCITDDDCAEGLYCVLGTCVSEDPTEPDANNSLDQTVTGMGDYTGMGTTITWLFFMIALAVFMFAYGKSAGANFNILIPIILMMEFLMFIVGVKMDYLSSGMMWSVIIVALIVGGVWVSKFFMSHRSDTGG